MTYRSDLFLRAKLPMDEVLARYGIKPNRSGFICCPFHAEKTASCRIYDRSFYCFGCGSGGDAVTFVSRYENIPPKEAAVKLVGEEIPKPRSYKKYRAQIDRKYDAEEEKGAKTDLYRRLLYLLRACKAEFKGHLQSSEPSGKWLTALHASDRIEFLIDEAERMDSKTFDTIYGEEVIEFERILVER